VNGISGIAVGFATNILPRSVSDIVTATRTCIKNEKKFLSENIPLRPTFPHFKGIVTQEDNTGLHWSTTGSIEYIGKYSYKISELPIGYDRESYVILLNSMIDKDLIRDFSDECSEDGFGFVIKASGAQKEQIDKDPIKYFKLQKQHSENLTTLGTDGKLKIFQSVSELIAYFCSYRTTKFGDKLSYDIDSLNYELNVLRDKIKFIHCVIDDKINFKTTTKAALLEYITTNITNQDYGRRFVSIPLYECTLDAVSELNVRENEIGKELGVLHSYTPEKMFLEKLTNLKL
jgi:DNA topoisomerase-2